LGVCYTERGDEKGQLGVKTIWEFNTRQEDILEKIIKAQNDWCV